MNFVEGQGVLGKITFRDGKTPKYDRTYLVVSVLKDYIEVLNVSSLKGKERKLAYSTNKEIKNYNPPFLKPSFVKLDSLSKVEKNQWDNLQILHNGETLNINELNTIINQKNKYPPA